jgi:hypothetical protein
MNRNRTIAQQGGQPERRIGRILKSKVLGRRRVTLVISPSPVLILLEILNKIPLYRTKITY